MKKCILIGIGIVSAIIGYCIADDLPFIKRLNEENERREKDIDEQLNRVMDGIHDDMVKRAHDALNRNNK